MRRVSYPIDREDYNPPAPIRKPFRGYDWVGSDDDGSVEIDLSRSNYRSGVSHGEPQFKSKVSEAIWRLKNKKWPPCFPGRLIIYSRNISNTL